MKNSRVDLVDFHSHILPGVDHGSSSISTSLEQLDIAKKYGGNRIIATPHFYPHVHTLDSFLALRERSAKKLLESRKNDIPEIKIGAEVLLCEGLDRLPGLEKLCFSGTNHLLLEIPFNGFKAECYDTIYEILKKDINIILAHANKYSYETINEVLDIGVNMMQLNASSLSPMFPKKHLFEWIRAGHVVALGSDIHGRDTRAYKNFKKAKKHLADNITDIKNKSDAIWNEIKSDF